MQYMGLCVFHLPIYLMMIVRILVLYIIIIIKWEVWPICHLFRVRSWNRVRQNGTANWWVGCKKQVSRTGTSNYIPQHLWYVITCPCPRYLPLAHRFMVIIAWSWMTKSFYECIFKLLIMYMLWSTDDISESVIPITLFPIFTGLWHVLIQLDRCDLIYYHIYAYTFSPPG